MRPHLLALSLALALFGAPAHAMTSKEALVLVAKAASGDAGALAKLQAAAQNGDANAQTWLGDMYADGYGVPQDYAQAVSWYRKAAEQGDADAQYSLGVMYRNGQGVPQDAVIAYALYNLSAAKDSSKDNPATSTREKISAMMTPRQIAEGQALTRRMLSEGVLKAIDAMR